MGKKKRRPRGGGGFRFDARRGLWVARVPVGRYPSGDIRYREVSDRTQAGCLRKMQEVEPAGSATTVRAWAEKWLAGLSGRPGTRDTYANAVRNHIAPGLGAVKLCDLRPSHVKAFTAGLVAAYSAAFARQVAGTLRAILDAAVAEDLIAKNPAKSVPKPKVPPSALVPYTPEQLKLLITSPGGSSAGPIVALLAACGCRLGEAAALDVTDYDGARISITRTYRPPHGMGPPKSHRSRRTITVPAAARPALEFAIGGREAGTLFRRPHGDRYTAATVQTAFRRHCGRLGLPVKKLHALRHSVITALVGKGWPLADVAKFAGDSLAEIVKTYVHPLNRDPAECLNELFN